MVAGDYIML